MAELDGLATLEAALASKLRQLVSISDAAMAENAEHLLGEAMQRAPYEIGDLKGSGDVRPLGDGQYEVGFYGQGVKAIVQHERLDFQHPIKGEAKYLEGPFAENLDAYVANVADAIRKAF